MKSERSAEQAVEDAFLELSTRKTRCPVSSDEQHVPVSHGDLVGLIRKAETVEYRAGFVLYGLSVQEYEESSRPYVDDSEGMTIRASIGAVAQDEVQQGRRRTVLCSYKGAA